MRILVINPNSTESMTHKIADSARRVACAGVEIVARTSRCGPASIQGEEDGRRALPGVLELVRESADENIDAIVIACFDDTGLNEAREIAHCLVVGIGEAAFHAAMLIGCHYSVVTTLSVSVPVIKANLQDYGLASHCLRVRASEVAVLDLEKAGSAAEQKISAEIALALAEDKAEAIVLGCAGMTTLAARMSTTHGIPVIDGVAAATGMACALVGMDF